MAPRWGMSCCALLVAAAVAVVPAEASHVRRGPTSPKSHHAAAATRSAGRGATRVSGRGAGRSGGRAARVAGRGRGRRAGRAEPRAVASNRPRGMDDARANEIQTALVKAGYLQEASGHWDESSAAAMRKMQADNGWQTKLIPDSRALIKLGLGPGAGAPETTSNLIGPVD